MTLKIVADGKKRNDQANYEMVLSEVAKQYTARGLPRSAWQKFWLERRIRQEVQVRLHKMFSSGSQYLSAFTK